MLTGIFCVLSLVYIYVCKKNAVMNTAPPDTLSGQHPEELPANVTGTVKVPDTKPVITYFHGVKKILDVKTKTIILIGLVLNVFACYRVISFELTFIINFKICVTLALLLSAMIIDLEFKRIPNILIGILLGIRVVFLIPEFIFLGDDFGILLAGSVIGLLGGFMVMFLLSFISRGGIGMGDVKLISGLGFLSGVAAAFYSLVYGMILCVVFALTQIALKKKKLKDEIAFGPFIYLGYVLAVVMGTF